MPSRPYWGSVGELPREFRDGGQYQRTGLTMDGASVCFVWRPEGYTIEKGPDGRPEHHHAHPFDMLVYVLEGQLRWWMGDETIDVKAGDFVYTPRDVFHSAEPLDGSGFQIIEMFAPIRTDYLYVSEHQLAGHMAKRAADGSRTGAPLVGDTPKDVTLWSDVREARGG